MCGSREKNKKKILYVAVYGKNIYFNNLFSFPYKLWLLLQLLLPFYFWGKQIMKIKTE